MTTKSTGFHQCVAHIANPGIVLPDMKMERCFSPGPNLLPEGDSSHFPACAEASYGCVDIDVTTPPVVTGPSLSAGGALPHVSLDELKSGTVPSGHSLAPASGARTGIVAVYTSPRNQMSTGSFTSWIDPSVSLRRISTGNGIDVCLRSWIIAMFRPSVDAVAAVSIPMSSTSFV